MKKYEKFFQNISRDGIITNKTFWRTMKCLLTNKGHISSDKVIVKKANKSENYLKLLTKLCKHCRKYNRKKTRPISLVIITLFVLTKT